MSSSLPPQWLPPTLVHLTGPDGAANGSAADQVAEFTLIYKGETRRYGPS